MKISYGQSILKNYLENMFPFVFKENYRPSWLNGLELDYYNEELMVAFEFNGDQHYFLTEFGDPEKQKRNDQIKRNICKNNNVKLFIIEACDLEYTRLNNIAKRACPQVYKSKIMPYEKLNTPALKIINTKASAYRKLLIEKYDSPTARKVGSNVRLEAIQNTDKSSIVELTERDKRKIKKKEYAKRKEEAIVARTEKKRKLLEEQQKTERQ